MALTITRTSIPIAAGLLEGDLTIPANATGLVVFVHGSGSSRHSIRNQNVASVLNAGGLATLLFDLLTEEEEARDRLSGELRFDIALLARRLSAVTDWLAVDERTAKLPLGYFGASTGAAAAAVCAAYNGQRVRAVVSRGGRIDLAGQALEGVRAPTLLIVGSEDHVVLELNESARQRILAPCRLEIVPGATHLFEEPGALDHVARLALDWFQDCFAA